MQLSDFCIPSSYSISNNLCVSIAIEYDERELQSADVFLIGYSEDRNSDNKGAGQGIDIIRKKLYALHETSKSLRILDLGDCKQGQTISESYTNLQMCMQMLAVYGKPVVVFGGTQEAVCSLAAVSLQATMYPSVSLIDAKIDMDILQEDFSNKNYIEKLCSDNPNVRLTHVSSQEYLSSPKTFEWWRTKNYPLIRLGECNENMEQAESLVRDAQLVSFDMNSIRYSDNPAGQNVNGLYAESACQCAWNAGYSPRMSTFFLTEYNPQKDLDFISAQLTAQILWHVFDGISQRANESGDFYDESYKKRYLKHKNFPQNICFFESTKSKALWVEVIIANSNQKRVIPCSRKDFDLFISGIVPDIWMTELQRLSCL